MFLTLHVQSITKPCWFHLLNIPLRDYSFPCLHTTSKSKLFYISHSTADITCNSHCIFSFSLSLKTAKVMSKLDHVTPLFPTPNPHMVTWKLSKFPLCFPWNSSTVPWPCPCLFPQHHPGPYTPYSLYSASPTILAMLWSAMDVCLDHSSLTFFTYH